MPDTIALCFMLVGDPVNWPDWEKWLSGHESEVRIYAHISPGRTLTIPALKRAVTSTRLPTSWGSISVVRAEGLMYAEAMRCRSNKYFVLLSDNSYPVVSFEQFKRRLFRSPKGIMTVNRFENKDYRESFIRNGDPDAADRCTKSLSKARLYKSLSYTMMFKILSRDGAADFLKMVRDKRFMAEMSGCMEHVIEVTSAPDETFYPTYLYYKYGSMAEIKARNRPGYSHWVKMKRASGPDGSIVWNAAVIKRMSPKLKQELCAEKSLFIRKVLPSSKLRDSLPMSCHDE